MNPTVGTVCTRATAFRRFERGEGMAQLAVDELYKSFAHQGGMVKVLAGISLSLESGDFVAVIGPSGCGKSTLFEIICGLQRPDSGRIALNGEFTEALTGKVAYMPQSDLLFPWRRLLENVTLPLEIKGVARDAAVEKARRWLPLFGLDGFEKAYPNQLSGGMRQRAALLRTFMAEREIVALDEPFGALDAHTRRCMQGWLADLRGRLGNTILLITHDVEEALILADRVVVLSRRPARVLAEIGVDLPRPRNGLSEGFIALKGEILQLLDGGAPARSDQARGGHT